MAGLGIDLSINMGSGFSPLSVAGAKIWLKAETGLWKDAGVTPATTNGDLVYQWDDQSGSGNTFTQTTAGNRPAVSNAGPLSKSVLFTSGNSNYMISNSVNVGSTFAIFAVTNATLGTVVAQGVNTQHQFVYWFQLAGSGILSDGSGYTDADLSYKFTTAPTLTTLSTVQLFYDGTNVTTMKNGSQVGTAVTSPGPQVLANVSTIGRLGDFAGDYLNNSLLELILYAPCPSTINRAAIETYLRTKYTAY